MELKAAVWTAIGNDKNGRPDILQAPSGAMVVVAPAHVMNALLITARQVALLAVQLGVQMLCLRPDEIFNAHQVDRSIDAAIAGTHRVELALCVAPRDPGALGSAQFLSAVLANFRKKGTICRIELVICRFPFRVSTVVHCHLSRCVIYAVGLFCQSGLTY
nr:hypothetical protein [Caballeronia insecticola]